VALGSLFISFHVGPRVRMISRSIVSLEPNHPTRIRNGSQGL
jgi:hypothetical protein